MARDVREAVVEKRRDGPYRPIVGTLGYVLSPSGTEVLLVHRVARKDDEHFGKYNGLGGKLRPDEDVASCMRREIREEAGIEVMEMRLRGTVNWTGFGPNLESWLGFVFLVTRFSGTPRAGNEEGSLDWHPLEGILELPMWEGDRHFLPLVFDDDPRLFHGYMPYERERVLGWSCERV